MALLLYLKAIKGRLLRYLKVVDAEFGTIVIEDFNLTALSELNAFLEVNNPTNGIGCTLLHKCTAQSFHKINVVDFIEHLHLYLAYGTLNDILRCRKAIHKSYLYLGEDVR